MDKAGFTSKLKLKDPTSNLKPVSFAIFWPVELCINMFRSRKFMLLYKLNWLCCYRKPLLSVAAIYKCT